MTDRLGLSTDGIKMAKRVIGAMIAQRYDSDALGTLMASEQAKDPNYFGVEYAKNVYGRWMANGRQVLSMHPGLVDEVRAASSSKIEPEVFRTLPYINPMVVFPDPVELPSWCSTERMRMIGVIFHGRIDTAYKRFEDGAEVPVVWSVVPDSDHPKVAGELQLTDTNDPDSNRFGMFIVSEVWDLDGNFKTYEFNRTSFDLKHGGTLEQYVEGILHGFVWARSFARSVDETNLWTMMDAAMMSDPAEDVRLKFMRAQLATAVGCAMYLCSTVLDVELVPRKTVARYFDHKARKHPIVINVGWTIGPALTAYRRQPREKRESDMPGRTVQPHQRRAHFAIRWTGKGRTVPKTVFIAPTWVHKELLHLTETKTVRAVPKP